MAKQISDLLQEALQICEDSGWVVPEREQLRAENERLKAQISELSDWNQVLEEGARAEAFLSGFEAGKKGHVRVASLEAEMTALKAKHKEELRAAKYAAWNAACDEIRAAALVVGSQDHKYILDAMGEFK